MNVAVKVSTVHGRGVFASRPLLAGSLIEDCPILRVLDPPAGLLDYVFGENALLLGNGSLYNHRNPPNARQVFQREYEKCLIYALRDIALDEEVFIDYGRDWWVARGALPFEESTQYLRNKFI